MPPGRQGLDGPQARLRPPPGPCLLLARVAGEGVGVLGRSRDAHLEGGLLGGSRAGVAAPGCVRKVRTQVAVFIRS